MNVNNVDEKTLLLKARKFDDEALSEIYEIFSPALYRYSMRLLGNQQLAEDCISDTFLRFLKTLRSGGGPSDQLQAYLFKIAHNWITDFYRRKDIHEDEPGENLPALDTSPDDLAHHNIQVSILRQALSKLSNDQQLVIIMKYIDCFPNENIAIMLNRNHGAVRALAFRALKTLRNKVKELEKNHALQKKLEK